MSMTRAVAALALGGSLLAACSSTPAGLRPLCQDFAALTQTVDHLNRGDESQVDVLVSLKQEQQAFAGDAAQLSSEGADDLANLAQRIAKSLGDLISAIVQNVPAAPSIAELRAAAQGAPSCP